MQSLPEEHHLLYLVLILVPVPASLYRTVRSPPCNRMNEPERFMLRQTTAAQTVSQDTAVTDGGPVTAAQLAVIILDHSQLNSRNDVVNGVPHAAGSGDLSNLPDWS